MLTILIVTALVLCFSIRFFRSLTIKEQIVVNLFCLIFALFQGFAIAVLIGMLALPSKVTHSVTDLGGMITPESKGEFSTFLRRGNSSSKEYTYEYSRAHSFGDAVPFVVPRDDSTVHIVEDASLISEGTLTTTDIGQDQYSPLTFFAIIIAPRTVTARDFRVPVGSVVLDKTEPGCPSSSK